MPISGSRFSKGMKDGLPIALGYLSVSFAFGMISVKNGLPFWVPISISLPNYTGTGQFAGMELSLIHIYPHRLAAKHVRFLQGNL